MTYNIHRAIGVDRRFRPERVAGIAAHHAPDILLLQEVDEGVPRSQRMDLADEFSKMLGYPHYVVGHNVTLRRGRYGNATLSRYPIVDERNIDLTIGGYKRRGCQYTAIAVPSANARGTVDGSLLVSVFNLHLGLGAQERARQVGLLARSDELRRLDIGAPCLIGGDFNDWRLLLHPVFTDVLGFQCATQRQTSYTSNINTYPSFSPSGSLDRFYYRGLNLSAVRACRLKASRVASDHLPVIADFIA